MMHKLITLFYREQSMEEIGIFSMERYNKSKASPGETKIKRKDGKTSAMKYGN